MMWVQGVLSFSCPSLGAIFLQSLLVMWILNLFLPVVVGLHWLSLFCSVLSGTSLVSPSCSTKSSCGWISSKQQSSSLISSAMSLNRQSWSDSASVLSSSFLSRWSVSLISFRTFFRLLCHTTESHFRYLSVSLSKTVWATSLHMMEFHGIIFSRLISDFKNFSTSLSTSPHSLQRSGAPCFRPVVLPCWSIYHAD